MRSKEEAHDYRYFPEPDLPPLVVTPARIGRIRATMPELPGARRRRFVDAYQLPAVRRRAADAVGRASADYFEAAVRAGRRAKAASNWIMGDSSRQLNDHGLDDRRVRWRSRSRQRSSPA